MREDRRRLENIGGLMRNQKNTEKDRITQENTKTQENKGEHKRNRENTEKDIITQRGHEDKREPRSQE